MLSTKTKGYILGCIASGTYGLIPLFALPLYAKGMNVDSTLLLRYLFAMPVMAGMLIARGRTFGGMTAKQYTYAAVLGIIMAFSSLFLFMSFKYIAVGIASTILFVYPIMVAAIMTIFFKERLSKMTIFCILMTCFGIGLLYNPQTGGTQVNAIGLAYVLAAALSNATFIVGVNRPVLRGVSTLLLTFYFLGFGSLLFMGRILYYDNLTLPSDWSMWFNLIMLATLTTAISFLCTTTASQYVGATVTAILGAVEPVTAVLVGVLAFGEVFTIRETVGLAIIVISVTMVIASGKITGPLVRFRKLFPRLRKKKSVTEQSSQQVSQPRCVQE